MNNSMLCICHNLYNKYLSTMQNQASLSSFYSVIQSWTTYGINSDKYDGFHIFLLTDLHLSNENHKTQDTGPTETPIN